MTNWKQIRDEALAHLHAGMDFIRAIELASNKRFNTVAEVLDYISAEAQEAERKCKTCIKDKNCSKQEKETFVAECDGYVYEPEQEAESEEPNLDENTCNTCDGCEGCVKAEPRQKAMFIKDTEGHLHNSKYISEINIATNRFLMFGCGWQTAETELTDEVIQKLGIEVI